MKNGIKEFMHNTASYIILAVVLFFISGLIMTAMLRGTENLENGIKIGGLISVLPLITYLETEIIKS